MLPDHQTRPRPGPVVHELARIHLGAHGTCELRTVLELADPRAESPMETRIRMALVLGGLPAPEVQFRVLGGRYRLDLAHPERMLAIEDDGEEHRTQARAREDLEREAALVRLGRTVLHHPEVIVRSVRSRLSGQH